MRSFLGKSKKKLNGRQLKRLRARQEALTQVHAPMVLPEITSGYSLYQTPKIFRPSSSVDIFDRHDRDDNLFSLPCFADKKAVIVMDSIGKNMSTRYLPDRGFGAVSMSGLDILELSLLLSFGQLNYDNEKFPILMSKRKEFGIYNEKMPRRVSCRTCKNDCLSSFSGFFISGCTLNNSLKTERKSFARQNMKNLFEIFESTLLRRCPNLKKIVYIRPLRPVNMTWQQSSKSVDIFDETLKILSKKPFVIGCPFYAIDKQGHLRDGIHLDGPCSESYYRSLMTELQDIMN